MDKTISCHNCEAITTINDEYGDIPIEDLKYCPCCGSDNIDVDE